MFIGIKDGSTTCAADTSLVVPRSASRRSSSRNSGALISAPRPVELLKNSLSKADKNDDRVWLGWANHAILTGQFAEASSWLKRCLSRRPDDRAVWQAQLDLALATGDVDGFWTAVPHLPADRLRRVRGPGIPGLAGREQP